ncbi:MAG: tetratricopeptide repeat protein [Gammaproteobacteria bacterium]|nr:tetratricopeptide repeat protein [Gammaproteobacteria bacterium]
MAGRVWRWPARAGERIADAGSSGIWRVLGLCCVMVSVAHGADTPPSVEAAPSAGDSSNQPQLAHFVGRTVCRQCHLQEEQHWLNSPHDLAMQEANEKSVLGDFQDARFDYFGTVSTFFRRDGRYMVNTDGPDGKMRDYEIRYTFGYYPLQQYLIEMPGGRLQAFGIAWDSRPASEGGQRWFHLYPEKPVKSQDRLHWTRPDQNWNFMCAECHSTDLKKNYEAATDGYHTTWEEINVSCEACHGPGSQHVAWAKESDGKSYPAGSDKGLVVKLDERAGASWIMNPQTGTAQRNPAKQTHREIEMCARCHSRRGVLAHEYEYGKPLLETHLPQLLTNGMYFPDGQIEEEVYVYGSFLQSKMYQAGVTCSDCHEPHSLKLRAPGNAVCLQCHQADKFNTPAHHFHPVDSAGASCAECHMPPRTYMVVDPRHDHSMRVPRPDLSVKLGAPNACNQCHQNRTAEWAAEQVKNWYGDTPSGYQHYAETLQAARTHRTDAESLLSVLADNADQPVMARATALAALSDYLSPTSLASVQRGVQSDDPLLRLGAVDALQAAPLPLRWQLAADLLQDPVLAVRVAAGRLLTTIPAEQLSQEQQAVLNKAIADYIATQQANADRPESLANLGGLYADLGKWDQAEAAYRTALKLQPDFVPAYVNLADFYRLRGHDEEGEKLLRQALTIEADNADVMHSLGLLLVRAKRQDEALKMLAESARRSPDNPRYSYVYALALQSGGDIEQAIKVLEDAHQRFPGDREILYALASYHHENGNPFAARLYAGKLRALSPQDPAVQRLLQQLQE